MCDCFHLAFPNWHAASSGTEAARRARGPESGKEDESICDEAAQFTEGERPRPQGSSPVEEFPETEKYTDSDKECEAEHDPHHKRGKKTKKSGFGSMFDKHSTPKMSKLKEVPSPESGVIVKTAKDGCAEGLIYGGGGKEGIFIKDVVPESPASKSLKLKQGDQVLSATVYFDNVSYEDAIQILEHAQAYKVKLCLKRQPDITETEPTIESDAIPEEDLYAPEMREQEKTKRRGDTRISWPKFPSFGKGRKSRFTRSHSSSEAEDQRKLELSPTTSYTDSPIKSQDALKGKKRHKIKLSVLTRRGRVSSSEEQDTDTPTTGQISGVDIHQTPEASDIGSESPPGETPEDVLTVVEGSDLRLEQNQKKLTESETVQHKVELITIDSTMKTTDLTMALTDQESSSPIKSPEGKKKKKEKSELKMKLLGRDKLKKDKKDSKAKSPKRLKTLGASIEKPDQPEIEKSDVIPVVDTQIISSESPKAKSVTPVKISVPQVELDITDIALVKKSPKKGEEKTKKGKGIKQKQDTKTSPTFKLPKVGFSDIVTEETIQKINVNVEESKTNIKQFTTEGKDVTEDPYDKLSKSTVSGTQLPKREDIEIPGMEDVSKGTTAKGIKVPEAVFTGSYEEILSETVQMSIDVNSVKEAVSKLPGFKLPKVDTSGMPIPEEITVIDANAQRISVKTPTKVVETKTKQEAHVTKFDVTASPEILKSSIKLPKIKADVTSEELVSEVKVDPEKESRAKQKQSNKDIKTGLYIQEDIIMIGKESPEKVAIHQTPEIEKTKGTGDKRQLGGVMADIKIPAIETSAMTTGGELEAPKDDFEYIDSVGGSLATKDGGIRHTGFGVKLDAAKANADVSFPEIRGEIKDVEAEEHIIKLPKFGAVIPDAAKDINIDGAEIKTPEKEGKGSKFKIPSLSISMPKVKGPKMDVGLTKTDADIRHTEDIILASADVSIPEQKLEVKKPELEIKNLQSEGDVDRQGSKFKIPKFGIKMPKIKGPEFDSSLSKKDVDVTLPEATAKVKFPEAPDVDVTLGRVDVSIPEQKLEVKKPESEIQPLQIEGELDGQRSKFKMPKFGIKIPKIKGPEFDLSSSKKDMDVSEATAEVKFPEAPELKMEVEKPQLEIKSLETEGELDGRGGKFKVPKFGIKIPKIKGPEFDLSLSKKGVDVPEATAEVKFPEAHEIDVTQRTIDVSIPEQKLEVEKPQLDIKPLHIEGELDAQGGKFKIPKLGIKIPKVKGPEIDFSTSKKDVDITLPEAKAEVKLPDVELKGPSAEVEIKAPETKGTRKAGEGSPLKFKMPTFKLPKFGTATPNVSVEISDKNKDIQIPETQLKTPEDGGTVGITVTSTDIESPSLDMKTPAAELDGKGSKFKMPKFGISLPKVKGPEIDLSLSKKDVDATLSEIESEVKLPDVDHGFKVKVKAPEIDIHQKDVEGSPSKFKISAEVPDIAKDVKMDGSDINIPGKESVVNIATPSIDIEGPSIDMKTTGTEHEGKGSKFKMPKLGMSMPHVKGPEIHFGLSKKDAHVTLPEAKAEVKQPDIELKESSANVEIKSPEKKISGKSTDGSPSKFKMPTFKLPKFDVGTPNISAEVPDIGEDVKIDGADINIPGEAVVSVGTPSIDTSIDMKTPVTELDGKESKFKVPHLSFSMPKVKGPKIDLSLSKKDAEVTLPEAKADVKFPGAPTLDVNLGEVDVSIPDAKKPELEMQAEGKLDGQGGKFKVPKIKGPEFDLSLSKKDVNVTLPEMKAEVKLPDAPDVSLGTAKVLIPQAKLEVEKPELKIKPLHTEVELEREGSKFKMPQFGISMPKVKIPEIDLNLSKKGTDVTLPDAKAGVELPDAPTIAVDMKPPECEAEIDGHGSKFKMPKLGITMPKVKGPEIDLSFMKKDVDVSLPDSKVEVDIKAPAIEGGELKTPKELEMENLELEILSESELGGQGKKFKMPKLGMSLPKVKGPEIDFGLSKKDADVTLPEASAEVNQPDVELKEPSAKVEIKAPEIEAQLSSVKGSPSRFKMPTFKFPKFGAATPSISVEVPDIDKEIKIDGADMDISVPQKDVDVPEVKTEISLPEVEVKGSAVMEQQPGVEVDAKLKKPRFSLFSFSKSSKAPEVDVSAQGVTVAIPEGKVEVKGGEVDMKPECEAEIDSQGSKFKMPKFGITMPKVTGPEMDLSLSKEDVDVKLPEAKVEVKLSEVEVKASAEVEIKAPETQGAKKQTEGSPSKFKMPTFKLPKFGAATPKVSVEEPDVNKEGAAVDITAPGIDTEGLSVDVKGSELEGSGSKFKMPKFDISMPKVKGPELGLSLSKKEVDFQLPEATADVKLPDVEVKGPGAVTVEVPDMDKDIKIPEEVLAVTIVAPSIDTGRPSIDVKLTGTDHEGKGSKFKMPNLGFSVPQVKAPEFDLSLSKKDVDVTLPEAKAEVQLPDIEVKKPSTKVKIKAPGIDALTTDVEGSPSTFKMPTFKLPKVEAATPQVSVEVPELDKDIKVDGADLTLPEAKAEVKIPDVEIKEPTGSISVSQPPVTEGDVKSRKSSWTFPKFSFSKTSAKPTEADVKLDVPKVDVTLPEVKTEVHLPDIDIKQSSGISTEEAPATDLDAKLKKPRFSLPKLSFSKQSIKQTEVDISVPDVDVSLPEGNVEVKQPELDLKAPEGDAELDGEENKFKMPEFGISKPKLKGPEINLSLSKKDVDVTLPESEVQLPDVQTGHVEGSQSEFKMPSITLPKFGTIIPKVSAEVPDVKSDIQIIGSKLGVTKEGAAVDVTAPSIDTEGLSVDVKAKGIELEGSGSKFKMPKFDISMPKVKGPEAAVSVPDGVGVPSVTVPVPDMDKDIKIPEDALAVNIVAPSIDTGCPSIGVKLTGTDHEGKGSKFTLPNFGFSVPQVKAPEFDLSLSKKNVDVTLPEAKAEVQLPDIEVKEPSATMKIKAPGIDIHTTDVEGSPSTFKMPTFKLPKVEAATPQVSVEAPDLDKDIKVDGADLTLPEAKVKVKIPDVEIKEPTGSISVSQPPVTEGDVKSRKSSWTFPKFSFSKTSAKPTEADVKLDVPKVDVTLPEVKDVDVTLPESEVQLPDVQTGHVEGSQSEFKMPSITLPKFGTIIPKVSAEVPDVKTDIQIIGSKLGVTKEGAAVDVTAPSIDTEGLSVDVKAKGIELEGKGSKFKMPNLGFSGPQVKAPEIDLSLSKKDVDVTLPEVKAEEPSAKVEIKAPGIDVQTIDVEGSPSTFKMPTFKLPKFGASTPQVSVEVPDLDKDIKVDGADLTLPEAKAEVKIPDVEIKEPTGSISVSQPPVTEGDVKLRKSSWTLPKFSFSKTSAKPDEADVKLDVPKVDVTLPEVKTEVQLPEIDIKQSSAISTEEAPATDLDAKLKKPRFSLPKLSFSKQGSKDPEVDVSLPDVDVSLPEGKLEVKQPEVEIKAAEGDAELDGQESKFKMPKFGISKPKLNLSVSKKDSDVTLPEAEDGEVQLPDVKVKQPSAKMEVKAPETGTQKGDVEGSPSKLKMPTFTLPKFGAATAKASVEVPDVSKDIKIDGAKQEVPKDGATVDGTASGSKFKMPRFSISGSSKKDVEVPLPEAKAKLPDVKVKQPSAKMEIKTPETEAQTGNVEGSPSKYKMPTFTLPKFGAATAKASVEVPEVSKDIKIDGAKQEVPKEGATVDGTASGSKFKMPRFSISGSSKKDVEVPLPEAKAKLPDVKVKQPSAKMEAKTPEIEAQTGNVEGSPSKLKMPTFTLPKFGAAAPKASVEVPEVSKDIKIDGAKQEVPKDGATVDGTASGSKFKMPRFSISGSSKKDVEVPSPEAKADVKLLDVKVKQPEAAVSVPDVPIEEEAKLKQSNWAFPRFSFSRTGGKAPDVDVNLETPQVDVTSSESKAEVCVPDVEVKGHSIEEPPAEELDANLKKPRFSLPRFSFSKPSVKEPEGNADLAQVDVSLPEGEVKVKLPEVQAEVKLAEELSTNAEIKTSETENKDDVTVNITGPSVDIKTDASKAAVSDSETPKTETDNVGLASPSKFKFWLNFSKPKPEDEQVSVDAEGKDNQLEIEAEPTKGESKSPKMTLTSFGEILKNIDVEFDVPKTEQEEENLDTSKEVHGTDELRKQEAKGKETNTKPDTTKSPEKTGWFKFPRFGLTSPSEPAKISEKDKQKDLKSPEGETAYEESPTSSVQSSDAFADISSAMTSEHVGLSSSSPTKVTVKYSDPNFATGLGDVHGNIITSTTRTGLISVEPNLPEKITILSSSSEDTLRLESGKIHVITSNIQATPETQQARLLTAVQVQSAGGLPLQSEGTKDASWTVEKSQSGSRTVFEKHLVKKTSGDGQETTVITKQITHVFDSAEPISDETATSIQRLKDTVHTEKMKFFDGAGK
ncbi:neuroblast differentiation-associated protein AHNAK-like [Scomber japonicus]|uniref:neuroblast differentiation-associated protein AHNAK-like n=1 Tax=Scomber japonicus TaxID=13676 RepID=UPI002305FD29|nr:neuroblast differentiation-associated protein AHNAK-like [Scomber japonicus]